MGVGNGWRDAGDRRAHARLLAVLLAALVLVAILPPAAGAFDVQRPQNLRRADRLRRSPRRRDADLRPRPLGRHRRRPLRLRQLLGPRVGEEIDGAYRSVYVVTGADADAGLTCVVHAVNGQADSYAESDALAGRAPEAAQRAAADRPGAPRRRTALLARRLGRP